MKEGKYEVTIWHFGLVWCFGCAQQPEFFTVVARIQPWVHIHVYVYITPSELVEVSAAVPEGRNVIGRGVTPDKNVNTIQNPDGVK